MKTKAKKKRATKKWVRAWGIESRRGRLLPVAQPTRRVALFMSNPMHGEKVVRVRVVKDE